MTTREKRLGKKMGMFFKLVHTVDTAFNDYTESVIPLSYITLACSYIL